MSLQGDGDVEWVRGLCSRLGVLVKNEVSEGGCGTRLEVGGHYGGLEAPQQAGRGQCGGVGLKWRPT